MKFNHLVKYNGKYYPAGTDVPVGGKSVENKKVEKPKEDDFSQYMNPPEETKEVSYTKTEINRMPLDDLRKIAMNTGVDGAENMTGKELKEYLISVFGL